MDEERTPDDQETKTLSDMDDFTAPPAIELAGDPDEARKPRPKWLVPVVAAGIQADQVQDAKTVDAMHRTIKTAGDIKPQVVVCDASMSTSDLHAAADKARRTTGHLKDIGRDYAKAGKAVVASRDAKSLEDAKSALAGKKDEAARLLGDSDGKVADNATRDNLQKAIDQAGGVTGGKAKDYQDAAAVLQSAVDQVNASMQAKAQADQPAAIQQAIPSSPSYRAPGNQGGGWPVPAPAPTPVAPQGGGISPEANAWMNTHSPSKCHAGGPCGIG